MNYKISWEESLTETELEILMEEWGGYFKVDLTPSPKVYMKMLSVIIDDSPIEEDVSWAKEELERWRKLHA